MSNYIDEKIIPLKLEHCGNEEIFIKASYFNDVISIYTPLSFIGLDIVEYSMLDMIQ